MSGERPGRRLGLLGFQLWLGLASGLMGGTLVGLTEGMLILATAAQATEYAALFYALVLYGLGIVALEREDPSRFATYGAFLEWLAARTGGRLHAPGELGPVLLDAEAGRRVSERSETALWRAPGLVAWIAIFASIAWFVRRRAGLA